MTRSSDLSTPSLPADSRDEDFGVSRRHFALMSLLGLGAAACSGGTAGNKAATNGAVSGAGGAGAEANDITAKIKAAEDLFDVEFTQAEREQMKTSFEAPNEALKALRDFEKPNSLAPALAFDPRLRSVDYGPQADRVIINARAKPLPE